MPCMHCVRGFCRCRIFIGHRVDCALYFVIYLQINKNSVIMKKLRLLAVLFAGIAFAIVSCSKSSTGAKGDTGATGAAGPDSVIYSSWTTLAMTISDTQTNANGGIDTFYTQTITAPKLTSAFIDKGVVFSYIGVPGAATNGTDTAIYTIADASTYFGLFTQQFSPGEIDLFSLNFDYSGALYRYVLVPGSIAAGNSILKGYTKEQLKAIDYATLTKALGISNKKTTD